MNEPNNRIQTLEATLAAIDAMAATVLEQTTDQAPADDRERELELWLRSIRAVTGLSVSQGTVAS